MAWCQCAADAWVFLPDVGQHQQEGADDDSLKYLPVATEVGNPGHQQLTAQHHKTSHHGHGKTPSWQAQLDPWQREQREEAKNVLGTEKDKMSMYVFSV